MGRVRVAGLLAAVVLAPPLVPPAAATTVRPFFTVIGDGPRSVDITPAKPFSFEFDDAEVVGTGRYGGMLVWEVSPRIRSVGIVLAVAGGLGRFATPVTAGRDLGQPFEVTLEAGRTYRVYLLGDGHTEVRVRLTRGRAMTLRPTSPHRQSFGLATLDVGPTHVSPVSLRLPLLRGRNMHHLAIGQFETHFAVDPSVTTCYVPRGLTCAQAESALRTGSTSVTAGANSVIIGEDDSLLGPRIREARVEGRFTHNVLGKLACAVLSYETPVARAVR